MGQDCRGHCPLGIQAFWEEEAGEDNEQDNSETLLSTVQGIKTSCCHKK